MREPRINGDVYTSGSHPFKPLTPWTGPSACSAGGSLEWPAGRHGMCGDPYTGERKHEYGGVSATGTITGTYTEGQVVNMTIVITAAHKGRFMFRVCVIQDPTSERAELTDECLNQHILVSGI